MDTNNETSVDSNTNSFYLFEIYLEQMRTGDKLTIKKGLVEAQDTTQAEEKIHNELIHIRISHGINENESLQLGYTVFSLIR
jgi:hypothetical protein